MNTNYGINDIRYSEEAELAKLSKNLWAAVEIINDDFDINIEPTQAITIIVNGIAHEFLLGGPQVAGLDSFIETISSENGYEVPWKANVTDYSRLTQWQLYTLWCKDCGMKASRPATLREYLLYTEALDMEVK